MKDISGAPFRISWMRVWHDWFHRDGYEDEDDGSGGGGGGGGGGGDAGGGGNDNTGEGDDVYGNYWPMKSRIFLRNMKL